MNALGPIVVIEDDVDDQHMLVEVFEKLGYPNKVFYFADGNTALNFLSVGEMYPLFILADINMPKINGFEVLEKILSTEKLRAKNIHYLFFTTALDKHTIKTAHSLPMQGYFIKPNTQEKLQDMIKKIVDYWQASTSSI